MGCPPEQVHPGEQATPKNESAASEQERKIRDYIQDDLKNRNMDMLKETTFQVKNLGPLIEGGKFSVKPLTLFCGPNNTGKTWTMYSLCHFLELCKSIIDKKEGIDIDEKERIDIILEKKSFNKIFTQILPAFFNSDAEIFANTQFSVSINDKTLEDCLKEMKQFPDTFLIPAERNGLHLFFRELSNRRTTLLHHASKKEIDIDELLRDVILSPYAQPIADYIDWLNTITTNHKTTTKKGIMEAIASKNLKDILQGTYKIDKEGRIDFKPRQKKRGTEYQTPELALHLTSSTVKSFFGLWYYLSYQAEKDDFLMIDEPEINIHPENQRKIARLIARLVNNGVYCIISTHSDYFVRELNNLIMLDNDEDNTLKQKYKYAQEETLHPEKVGAYLFDKGKIEPFDISPDDGIYATTFDKVITDLNDTNNGIYYALKENNDE